jgi:hypothetical protein
LTENNSLLVPSFHNQKTTPHENAGIAEGRISVMSLLLVIPGSLRLRPDIMKWRKIGERLRVILFAKHTEQAIQKRPLQPEFKA